MLIFISDLHFTDSTTGPHNVSARMMEDFARIVRRLKRHFEKWRGSAGREAQLVVLGDFVDVLRTTYWLNRRQRPWDPYSPQQRELVARIVKRVVRANEEALAQWRPLWEEGVRFSYVLGNHDRWLRRNPDAVRILYQALGLSPPSEPLPIVWRDDEYGVLAHHGHFADPYCLEPDPRFPRELVRAFDTPSINEPLALEVYVRWTQEVLRRLKGSAAQRVGPLVQELDNVRPVTKVPLWLLSTVHDVGHARLIKRCWDTRVARFFQLDFVQRWMKRHDKFLDPMDHADQLQLSLRASAGLSLGWLATMDRIPLISRGLGALMEKDESSRQAYRELQSSANAAMRFVVYGHTHFPRVVPLDGSGADSRVYLNTGTWRRVYQETSYGVGRRAFQRWRKMPFAVLYPPQSKPQRRYEFWEGTIGE